MFFYLLQLQTQPTFARQTPIFTSQTSPTMLLLPAKRFTHITLHLYPKNSSPTAHFFLQTLFNLHAMPYHFPLKHFTTSYLFPPISSTPRLNSSFQIFQPNFTFFRRSLQLDERLPWALLRWFWKTAVQCSPSAPPADAPHLATLPAHLAAVAPGSQRSPTMWETLSPDVLRIVTLWWWSMY